MKVKSIRDKFYSILGLCQKAGKLISGSTQCEKVIRAKKAALVIISSEASKATADKFHYLCKSHNIRILTIGTKKELGHAIGKGSRTLVTVLDSGFSEILLKEYKQIQHGGDQIWQK